MNAPHRSPRLSTASPASRKKSAAILSSARKRVFLVEDHPVTREGLAQLVAVQPDLQVCGQAGTATEAATGIASSRPDLVVIDLSLDGTSGLDLIKSLRSQGSEIRILVLSTHEETLYAERALRAGAQGYAMKQSPTREVMDAMRRVLRGDVYLSPAMSSRVLHRLAGGVPAREKSPALDVERLTDRELEIFRLIGQGVGTRDIARQLHLSVSTVETHRAHIKEKLYLRNAMELVRRAVEWVSG